MDDQPGDAVLRLNAGLRRVGFPSQEKAFAGRRRLRSLGVGFGHILDISSISTARDDRLYAILSVSVPYWHGISLYSAEYEAISDEISWWSNLEQFNFIDSHSIPHCLAVDRRSDIRENGAKRHRELGSLYEHRLLCFTSLDFFRLRKLALSGFELAAAPLHRNRRL